MKIVRATKSSSINQKAHKRQNIKPQGKFEYMLNAEINKLKEKEKHYGKRD